MTSHTAIEHKAPTAMCPHMAGAQATAPETAEQVAPLSHDLKTSTAVAHDQAEHSTFMTELMGGKLDLAAFIDLQIQSWYFYSALERAVRQVSDHPVMAMMNDSRLDRADRLARDLDELTGSSKWRMTARSTAATAAYVERLEELAAAGDAPRLVAHHYVRYLGDLSGGQVIARMMQRYYDAPEAGLSFYRFEGIEKLKPYKDCYRAKLDQLPLTPEQRADMLDEAARAFLLNMNLFESLARK